MNIKRRSSKQKELRSITWPFFNMQYRAPDKRKEQKVKTKQALETTYIGILSMLPLRFTFN